MNPTATIPTDEAAEISDHLTAIHAPFEPQAKVTLLVRHPDHPDGRRDLVMTDDDLAMAAEALDIRRRADFIPLAKEDYFVGAVRNELRRARAKFPGPNPTIAALAEEVGELAQAMLHIREGKSADWSRVWAEAVQVAVMALRAATEGDATLGAMPSIDPEVRP